jgi:nitroreductase
MSTLIEKLSWRYATKKFDPARTVPTEKIDRIIEAVRLTATSSGLQPFELLLVTNPEIREKIRAVAWNQAQVTECSHLLVFAAWDDITPERVNMMFDLTNEVRGFVNEGWEITASSCWGSSPAAAPRPIIRLRRVRPISGSDRRWWRPLSKRSIPRRWKASILRPLTRSSA